MVLIASKQGRDAKSLCSTMQQVVARRKSWPGFPGLGNATVVFKTIQKDFEQHDKKRGVPKETANEKHISCVKCTYIVCVLATSFTISNSQLLKRGRKEEKVN
jgi:hypothetical protein